MLPAQRPHFCKNLLGESAYIGPERDEWRCASIHAHNLVAVCKLSALRYHRGHE